MSGALCPSEHDAYQLTFPTHSPSNSQESLYSGYYKGHGFKYLIVISPVGLLEEVAGPYPGRVADSRMVRYARLEQRLASFCLLAGRSFQLYGDPAFRASQFIAKPHRRVGATEAQSMMNTRMSRVRVTVEQAIGHVSQSFPAMDFVRTERVGDGDVCKKYLCACFLRNCLTCIRGGNQISEYFGCSPPSLEDFLDDRAVSDPLPPRLDEMGVFHAPNPEHEEEEEDY